MDICEKACLLDRSIICLLACFFFLNERGLNIMYIYRNGRAFNKSLWFVLFLVQCECIQNCSEKTETHTLFKKEHEKSITDAKYCFIFCVWMEMGCWFF